jgi:hypothetical protein
MYTPVFVNQLEEAVMPYLSAFARFRDQVRQQARDLKGTLYSIVFSTSLYRHVMDSRGDSGGTMLHKERRQIKFCVAC